jgi:membrane protein YqaA with SNARE-associated domain
VLGLFALLILCQTLCVVLAMLLSLAMDWRIAAWLGPLIGAVLLGVAGYALVRVGQRRLQREDLAPEHTLESLQEGKQWLQEKVS